jgi:hypothetical protein
MDALAVARAHPPSCHNSNKNESTKEYYPSKILGFIRDDNEVKAIIQCSKEAVPWMELEENFIAPFELNTSTGGEEIVPMSSLCHPICVVPDYGAWTDT